MATRLRPASSSGGRLHLLEELLHHPPDPHHLRGLLDEVGHVALPALVGTLLVIADGRCGHRHRLTVRADHHDVVGLLVLGSRHGASLPSVHGEQDLAGVTAAEHATEPGNTT